MLPRYRVDHRRRIDVEQPVDKFVGMLGERLGNHRMAAVGNRRQSIEQVIPRTWRKGFEVFQSRFIQRMGRVFLITLRMVAYLPPPVKQDGARYSAALRANRWVVAGSVRGAKPGADFGILRIDPVQVPATLAEIRHSGLRRLTMLHLRARGFAPHTGQPPTIQLNRTFGSAATAALINGYARVTTDGQTVAAHLATLTAAGAGKVFRKVASGAKTDRTQLRRALDRLEARDVLLVTRLDRLARSTRDPLNTLATITERKAGFQSLGDTWADTSTARGRLMLTVLGGLAEVERELIRARTGEVRARAKARGKRLGRPFKLTAHQRRRHLRGMKAGNCSAKSRVPKT